MDKKNKQHSKNKKKSSRSKRKTEDTEIFVIPPDLLQKLGINLANVETQECPTTVVSSDSTDFKNKISSTSVDNVTSANNPETDVNPEKETSILETANLMTKSVFLSPTFLPVNANIIPGELEISNAIRTDKNSADAVHMSNHEVHTNIIVEQVTPIGIPNVKLNTKPAAVYMLPQEIEENFAEELSLVKSIHNSDNDQDSRPVQEKNLGFSDEVSRNINTDIIEKTSRKISTDDHPDEAYSSDCSNSNLGPVESTDSLNYISQYIPPTQSPTRITSKNKINILSEEILSPSQLSELKSLHTPVVSDFKPVTINTVLSWNKKNNKLDNDVLATNLPFHKQNEGKKSSQINTIEATNYSCDNIKLSTVLPLHIEAPNFLPECKYIDECNLIKEVKDISCTVYKNMSQISKHQELNDNRTLELDTCDNNLGVCIDFEVMHLEENEESLEEFVKGITSNDSDEILDKIENNENIFFDKSRLHEIVVAGGYDCTKIIDNTSSNRYEFMKDGNCPKIEFNIENNINEKMDTDCYDILPNIVNESKSLEGDTEIRTEASALNNDDIVRINEVLTGLTNYVERTMPHKPISSPGDGEPNENNKQLGNKLSLQQYRDPDLSNSQNASLYNVTKIYKETNKTDSKDSISNGNVSIQKVEEIAMYLSQCLSSRRSKSKSKLSNRKEVIKQPKQNCLKSKLCIQGVEKPGGSKENIKNAKGLVLKTYSRTNRPKKTYVPVFDTTRRQKHEGLQNISEDLNLQPNSIITLSNDCTTKKFCLCHDFGSLVFYNCDSQYEHIHFWEHENIGCDPDTLFKMYNEDYSVDLNTYNSAEIYTEIVKDGQQITGRSICWNNIAGNLIENIVSEHLDVDAGITARHKNECIHCSQNLIGTRTNDDLCIDTSTKNEELPHESSCDSLTEIVIVIDNGEIEYHSHGFRIAEPRETIKAENNKILDEETKEPHNENSKESSPQMERGSNSNKTQKIKGKDSAEFIQTENSTVIDEEAMEVENEKSKETSPQIVRGNSNAKIDKKKGKKRRHSAKVIEEGLKKDIDLIESACKKNVKCGVCEQLLCEKDWKDHTDKEHCYIAWRAGSSIDLNNSELSKKLEQSLTNNGKLKCTICSEKKKSVKNFLSHVRKCLNRKDSPNIPKNYTPMISNASEKQHPTSSKESNQKLHTLSIERAEQESLSDKFKSRPTLSKADSKKVESKNKECKGMGPKSIASESISGEPKSTSSNQDTIIDELKTRSSTLETISENLKITLFDSKTKKSKSKPTTSKSISEEPKSTSSNQDTIIDELKTRSSTLETISENTKIRLFDSKTKKRKLKPTTSESISEEPKSTLTSREPIDKEPKSKSVNTNVKSEKRKSVSIPSMSIREEPKSTSPNPLATSKEPKSTSTLSISAETKSMTVVSKSKSKTYQSKSKANDPKPKSEALKSTSTSPEVIHEESQTTSIASEHITKEPKSKAINSDAICKEPQSNIHLESMTKCGVCKREVQDDCWIKHIAEKHDYLAWKDGYHALNLGNDEEIRQHLNQLVKQIGGLKCSKCCLIRKYPKSYLQHIATCRDNENSPQLSSNHSADNLDVKIERHLPVTSNVKTKENSILKCGVCGKDETDATWIDHIAKEHNYLAWKDGEIPLDLDDEEELRHHLHTIVKKTGFLVCPKCGLSRKYVKSYLHHITFCDDTDANDGSMADETTNSQCMSESNTTLRTSLVEESEDVKSSVICGVCKKEIHSVQWILHIQTAHNYLAWKEGEPLDINNAEEVYNHLYAISKVVGGLICSKCGLVRKYVKAYQHHLANCTVIPPDYDHDAAQLSKGIPQCGVCSEKVALKDWMNHKMEKHYNIAWTSGQTPVDIKNPYAVERLLKEYKDIKKKFVCMVCKTSRVSCLGFYAHILSCGKTEEEIEMFQNVCEICNKKYLCIYQNQHMAFHREQEYAKERKLLEAEHKDKIKVEVVIETTPGKRRAAEKAKTVIENYKTSSQFSHNCPTCGFGADSLRQMEKHVCKIKKESNSSDSEASVNSEGSDDDSGESGVNSDLSDQETLNTSVKKRIREYVSPPVKVSRIPFTVKSANNYLVESGAQFCKANFTTENLFGDWNKCDCEPVPNDRLTYYLPPLEESCKVKFSEDSWTTYSRFEAKKGNGCSIFVGACIQCLSWAPAPMSGAGESDGDNYLAIACHLSSDLPRLEPDATPEHAGLIQIWNFKDMTRLPKISLGIAHDFGTVWDMDWCPSGARDILPTEDVNQVFRLGLLAVSCSNGHAYVFSVPYPSTIALKSDKLIYKLKPVAELRLTMGSNRQLFQATSLRWSQQNGHAFVVVGYGDGTTAYFDLNTESPLLKTEENDVTIFYPYHDERTHNSCVLGLSVYPSADGKSAVGAVCSAAPTGAEAVSWGGARPVRLRSRLASSVAMFQPLWPAALLAGDDAIISTSANELEWWGGGRRLGPINVCAGCVHCARVVVSMPPLLRLMRLHPACAELKKQTVGSIQMIPIRKKRKVVVDELTTKLEPIIYEDAVQKYGIEFNLDKNINAPQSNKPREQYPERFPLADVRSMAFCPSSKNHGKLAVATHAGIVFLVNTG